MKTTVIRQQNCKHTKDYGMERNFLIFHIPLLFLRVKTINNVLTSLPKFPSARSLDKKKKKEVYYPYCYILCFMKK